MSLHRASSTFICQSAPRWMLLTSDDQALVSARRGSWGHPHFPRGSWGHPHFPGARGLVALSLTESGWPFPFRSFRPTAGRRAAKKTLIFPKTRSPARTSDLACRILRVAGQLLGNLDAVRSAAAVRPGTTRKVEVRVAWRANALGLKSVRTKPKSQGGKAI